MFTFFDLRKVVNTSCSLYRRAAVYLICASCVSVSTMARDIYTWQNVKIGGGGGFIPGIIYNESEKGLVYIRTDMGGLYRQDPTSKKWIPLTDFVSPEEWNMLGGESFATDPVEPNICYFAAGTYTNNWTNMNGMILRSTDYGNTWERYEMPIKFGGNMPGRSIGERLMIDPNCHSILYFGARSGNGLWKSIDSGKTWKKVSSFPVDGDFVQDPEYAYTADKIGIGWIAFDTTSSVFGQPSKRIFVGAEQATGPTVYESDDAGVTWDAIAGQPEYASYEPSDTAMKKNQVHIMPHHGIICDSCLYLSYNNKCGPYDGSYGEVWKYNIYEKKWIDITPHAREIDEVYHTAVLQTEKPYFGYGGISVDRQNPKHIIVSTLNSYWPDAILFYSEDGGKSWYRSFTWTSYPSARFHYDISIGDFKWLNWGISDSRFPDVVQPKLGWMIGDIEINPFNSNEMMYGTGATVYGTSNLTDFSDTTGSKKMHLSSWGDGIEECAVLSLAVPPTADGKVKLITGVGDIGGFTHTDIDTPVQMFQTPRFGHTSSIDYAELNPKSVVRVGTSSPDQYEDSCNIATSSDGGLSWAKSYEHCMKAKDGVVAMSAMGTYFVWSTMDKGVYGGKPYGTSAISVLPNGCYVASDRVNDSLFYAYFDSKFYKYDIVSNTLASSTMDSFPTGVCKIKAVPGYKGNVWIPCGTKGLWMTEDGGKTFIQPSTAVQQADIVGFGKAAVGKAYPAIYITGVVNKKSGVYRSIDKGVTWERINDDNHQYGSINYAVTGDMRTYGVVYFGTNGRGVICGKITGTSADTSSSSVISLADSSSCPVGFFLDKGAVHLYDVPEGAELTLFDVDGHLVHKTIADSNDVVLSADNTKVYVLTILFKGKSLSIKF